MMSICLHTLLALLALWIALPAFVDAIAWCRGMAAPQVPPAAEARERRLLFLVPAHNEELLVERCVASLLGQNLPVGWCEVVVIADNCSDATAERAWRAGAVVLERMDRSAPGKHRALSWALSVIDTQKFAAVIVVDADTVVSPDLASVVCGMPELEKSVLQANDGLTNEEESWVTRLGGLQARNRYGIVLPLKARAGLSIPLTGNGMVLGRDVLRCHGFHLTTLTEGWELYVKLTLGGIRVGFAPLACFFDQEARTMRQGDAQRRRWATGRAEVLRLYWRRIVSAPGLGMLQRLDLLAELSSPGPVMRASVGLAGAAFVSLVEIVDMGLLGPLFGLGVVQPVGYSLVSLGRHPAPVATAKALLLLPVYAVWRIVAASRAGLGPTSSAWVRTPRHLEDGSSTARGEGAGDPLPG